MVMSLQVVAGVFVIGGQVLDYGCPGGVEGFIGVQTENPFAGRVREGMIAGGGEIRIGEVEGEDGCAVRCRDLRGGVARSGIDHDHLGGEVPHGIEAAWEVALFVADDHAKAE